MDKENQKLSSCSALFQWKRWIWGWLVRVNYDRTGWWILDTKGFRNTLPIAYMRITDQGGQTARRIVFFGLMIEWGIPQ
jgi:hypothetical protein